MTELDATQVPDPRPATAAAVAPAAVEAYFTAWNDHDGAAVARVVTGTYVDPTLPAPISGDDLAAYVDGLCAAFPDLRFVIDPVVLDASGHRVVTPWRMRGTNDGAPLPGAPSPTGGSIDVPGVDIITVDDGRVLDVVGYFDQKTFVEQLGLQAVVMPQDSWPVSFGIATCVDLGNTTVPGAISFTWIEADGDDAGEVVRRGTEIVTALASDPAFIGWRGATVGNRNVTLTLWTSPEAAEAALARNGPHQEAMRRMLQEGLGTSGFTSIWQPFRVNTQFVTCTGCGSYVSIPHAGAGATCACGTQATAASYL